ncbi:hypothetical protein FGO68_gene9258 [Halteria grandinella]|uniref:Uncharacterized protein n=1 Tax=Halteria grandinella TaxID=5974 RepID=A0A8J8NKP0_HALGN|nr:hypothetical protein FGO68_gene9258 [Halteria grandinella]
MLVRQRLKQLWPFQCFKASTICQESQLATFYNRLIIIKMYQNTLDPPRLRSQISAANLGQNRKRDQRQENSLVKLAVMFSLCLTASLPREAKAGVSSMFQNSPGTNQADKCMVCVLAKQFFCTGVITKTQDCYDSINDCMKEVNGTGSAIGTSLTTVSWATQVQECGSILRPNTAAAVYSSFSDCQKTLKSNGDTPGGTIRVRVRKGEVCGVILRNDQIYPIEYTVVNPTGATVLISEMDSSQLPDISTPAVQTTPWDTRNFKKVHTKSNALLNNQGIFFIVGSLDWGIGVPSREQYVDVVFSRAAERLLVFASLITMSLAIVIFN